MLPADLSGQRILFSSLDWGSGHVARSIPLLQQLAGQKNTVFLWCTEFQENIFREYELPVNYIRKSGFSFRFKGDSNFTKEMSRNAIAFAKGIRADRKETQHLVQEHNISTVVSDHCYGVISTKIYSIFVTHQVQLPPKAGNVAQFFHKRWMNRFSEIWILDKAENRLARELSTAREKSTYIGWYSRFETMELTVQKGKTVAVISGPEPYAEQLFHEILIKYSGTLDLVIIAPKLYTEIPSTVRIVKGWKEADLEIASAERIISRNGYTTLMDLQFLRKESILIPTPGQLEQEYLAD